MAEVIPVDLIATGGRLTPPGADPTPSSPPTVASPGELPGQVPPPPPPAAPLACPNCGLLTTDAPDKPSAEDEAAFARAVWQGEPFRQTVSLYGGAVAVTFRTPSVAEEDAAQAAVNRAEAAGEFPPTAAGGAALYVRQVDVHLGFAVEQLRIGDRRPWAPPAGDVPADPAAAHAAVQAACGTEIAYRAVRAAYVRFARLADALTRRAADPSFCSATAAGGGSAGSPSSATRR